jgi:hypothetical protein
MSGCDGLGALGLLACSEDRSLTGGKADHKCRPESPGGPATFVKSVSEARYNKSERLMMLLALLIPYRASLLL